MKKVWFFLTFLLFVCIIEWEKIFTFLYTKMKNKRMLVKWCLVAMTLLFFWISFSSADVTFKFNVEAVSTLTDAILRRNIMPIHFADNWNDFGWFIYFSNWTGYEEDLESDGIFNVKLWSDIKQCKRQMKWIYYNAERWERSWPLDSTTLSGFYSWFLKTEGWIYTLCRPEWYFDALSGCQSLGDGGGETQADCVDRIDKEYAQDNAYYGMLKHTLTGSLGWDTFYLLAGVEYDTPSNQWVSVRTSNPKLVPNFIRFKNKTPVGFVYDNNWWVWFLGCRIKNSSWTLLSAIVKDARSKISNGQWLESLFEPDFDAEGNENGIKYRTNPAVVDCSDVGDAANSLIKLVVEGLVWMNRESDLWVIGNQTNAKMQYFSSSDINNATLLNYAKQRSEVLCRWKWNSVDGNVVCLDSKWGTADVSADAYIDKTLVVKDRNVRVKPATLANETWHYDIFVNNGNLIVDELETDEKFVFDRNGFVTTETVDNFNSLISGNYNQETPSDYTWDLVAVGVFIRWNFVVNWKVKAGSGDVLNNKYFIYGKFTTKDSLKELEDKFQWRCNNWYTTDGSYCPPSVRWWTNPYENASLVVIDQNYDSLLFGE